MLVTIYDIHYIYIKAEQSKAFSPSPQTSPIHFESGPKTTYIEAKKDREQNKTTHEILADYTNPKPKPTNLASSRTFSVFIPF
jgi:hypothetical protein